jgi:hypothetical protein
MKVTHTKAQIALALVNPAAVNAAIRILGENQTADELRTKSTRKHNDIGFSAAYGRVGTRFYEFVTGIQVSTGRAKWAPKSLAHPVADKVFSRYVSRRDTCDCALDYAREISLLHWKQLGALLTDTFDAPELPAEVTAEDKVAKQKKRDEGGQMITVSGEIVGARGRAYKAYIAGRKVWLPKSQVSITPGGIAMPKWLARTKGLVAA